MRLKLTEEMSPGFLHWRRELYCHSTFLPSGVRAGGTGATSSPEAMLCAGWSQAGPALTVAGAAAGSCAWIRPL